MAMGKKLIAGSLAGLALAAATTVAATAAPAYASSNVNVRSGPGTGFAIVDSLRRGEQVDVQYCRGSWCFVQKRGPDGWVSANYLDRGGRPGWDRPQRPDHDYNPRPPRPPHYNPRPPRPPHYYEPDYPTYPVYPSRPGASFCFNGPNGYFCAGS